MDANVDPILDEHVEHFLSWLRTLDGVTFCVTNMDGYYPLITRGLGDQRAASDLSDDLQNAVKTFLLRAEGGVRGPFIRDPAHDLLLTAGYQQDQRVLGVFAEAVAAYAAAETADATRAALEIDASQGPIPDRAVSDFLGARTRNQAVMIDFLGRHQAETAELAERGLRLRQGVDVSLDYLNDNEGLRRCVERFLALAERDGAFARRPESEDDSSEGSTDSESPYFNDRMREFPHLQQRARDAHGRHVAADNAYRAKANEVMAAVAAALRADEDEDDE